MVFDRSVIHGMLVIKFVALMTQSVTFVLSPPRGSCLEAEPRLVILLGNASLSPSLGVTLVSISYNYYRQLQVH